MEEEEYYEQSFADTVRENMRFATVYKNCASPKHFLRRSEKVYARSVTIDEVERDEYLQFRSDIDGCVLEISNLNGIKMPIRHLTFFPLDMMNLREVKSILKKHVNLTIYSKNELANFNNSVGFQLFYERGWECWISLIPSPTQGSPLLNKDVIKHKSYLAFLSFRSRLQKYLASYASEGIALRTLMKNDLNDIRKMFILPDDCSCILSAIQNSLTDTSMDNFRPVVFCFRFGEKMTQGLSLADFDVKVITNVTIHVAVDISSKCELINLFWSTAGLAEVIGQRGTLSTCLSFRECSNFQSNVDGRLMDVRPALRKVCRFPAKLRFIQLYSDLPHRLPQCRFHPVSGCIVGGICFVKQTSDAFSRDALRYISALESNWVCLKKSTCRLEFVVAQDTVSEIVDPNDFINLLELENLLKDNPMIVPFSSDILSCIRHLGIWIITELKRTLDIYQKTGNISATWYAYQLELASEKLLWGRPLCYRSISFSVNLGPGVLGSSRSLTEELGFLALEDSSACMQTEDSIPPYELWTLSADVGKSINRAIGLHDHLDASFDVIGRRLLCALLRDLHEIGKASAHSTFEEFIREMKSNNTRFQIVGATTRKSLVTMLSMKRRTDRRMVFPPLCTLIEKKGLSIVDVISSGLGELELRHFPAVKTYDNNGHVVLTWSYKDNFWNIVNDDESIEGNTNTLEMFSDLVKGDLEKRGLIYVSKLKKTPRILPWISVCLRKLKREKLTLDSTVTTLTVISCVALIMQGWYVEFDRLPALLCEMPINQSRLKALEILSKFELSTIKFHQLKLFRLHFSIPHKLPVVEPEKEIETRLEKKNDEENCDKADDKTVEHLKQIGEDEETDNQNVGYKRESICLPITNAINTCWSSRELEILHAVSISRNQTSMKQMYDKFKLKCIESKIPFRTFRAFECKIRRM